MLYIQLPGVCRAHDGIERFYCIVCFAAKSEAQCWGSEDAMTRSMRSSPCADLLHKHQAGR